MTPAHLVTIVADAKLGDFDATCSCGWLGGSHLFRDLAYRAVQEHYAEISGHAQRTTQQIHMGLADILAAADLIRVTDNVVVKAKAKFIIAAVISLSALIPAPEKESHE